MLELDIPAIEGWDERAQEFVKFDAVHLKLEHSLISLSKWESKWCKPFFSKEDKTYEETLDYIKCMTLTKNVDNSVYLRLTQEHMNEIQTYIKAPMTATTISQTKQGRINNEIITSELIYYWMIALTIPVEFEKWHINRLITLIQICNIKNQPAKKMSKRDVASRYAALNAARRQKLGTSG